MRKLLCLACALVLLPSSALPPPLLPTPPSSAPAVRAPRTPEPQLRGLWVDAFGPGLKSAKEIDAVVSSARALGMNAIFAQVGRRFDCYCLKASVPPAEDRDWSPTFDSLAYLLEKAHAQGIQVHAWMITTAVRSKVLPAPRDPGHAWNAHGEDEIGPDNWLIYRQDGTAEVEKDYYLDVSNPYASEYIAQMYASVVRKYPVDGIMLDRVRYPDLNPRLNENYWGFSEIALARFRAETGFRGTPRAGDKTWTDWRRDQVNHLVRRIFLEVKAINPRVWVSAATITYGKAPRTETEFDGGRAFLEVLQDWPRWSREGWLDLNVTMNYKRQQGEQGVWYSGWNRFARTLEGPGAARQAAGSALYLNSIDASFVQAKDALAQLNAWVAYSWRNPSLEGEKGRSSVLETLGTLLSTVDPAPALGDPKALRALRGTLSGGKRPATGVKVELWQGGKKVLSTVSDGGGLYGFVNVPGGPLELRVAGLRPQPLEVETDKVLTLPVLTVPAR